MVLNNVTNGDPISQTTSYTDYEESLYQKGRQALSTASIIATDYDISVGPQDRPQGQPTPDLAETTSKEWLLGPRTYSERSWFTARSSLELKKAMKRVQGKDIAYPSCHDIIFTTSPYKRPAAAMQDSGATKKIASQDEAGARNPKRIPSEYPRILPYGSIEVIGESKSESESDDGGESGYEGGDEEGDENETVEGERDGGFKRLTKGHRLCCRS